jgi:hypothetical protein
MFKHGQILQTDADLENAKLIGVAVEVWQRGEIIDYGGPVQRYDEAAVHILDGYFLRKMCEFKVR